MAPVRRAVIDVGTNSVKLLVADVRGRWVAPVWERSHQTRLGDGFYRNHELQPGPVAETARAVADFAGKACQQGADSLRVIATSAAREARNAASLLEAVREASGLEVEIISGEAEADYAFRGVATQPGIGEQPMLLLEIGGGSTQMILGSGERQHFRQSFPLGSVRLLHACPHSNPPGADDLNRCRKSAVEFLRAEVRPGLEQAMAREMGLNPGLGGIQLVGTGGTMSILARMEAGLEDYDRERMEAVRLSRGRVQWHVNTLWSLPLESRKRLRGLPPNRADVILTGAVICEAVMDELEFGEMRISTRGLRFGALLD